MEVSAVRTGEAFVAIATEGPVIFFLYRFDGACGWSDAPFSWHLVPEAERTLPDPSRGPETRALIHVILVDAATGIIRALRSASLSPRVTEVLHVLIARQAQAPWDALAYDQELERAYARFPRTEDLVAQARAKCRLGE